MQRYTPESPGSRSASAPRSTQGQSQEAKQKAQQVAGEGKERAQQAARQAKERLRGQVDQRSTQAGEQVTTKAQVVQSIGDQLREQGEHGPAKVADHVAQRAERLGGYLQQSDADRILQDAEDLARKNPWAVAAGGLAVGFVASRFLQASSSKRSHAARESASLSEQGPLASGQIATGQSARTAAAVGAPPPARVKSARLARGSAQNPPPVPPSPPQSDVEMGEWRPRHPKGQR
jgi:ElaB/YqjD/DUF883 family membrane-anchored ribosome-binding protein